MKNKIKEVNELFHTIAFLKLKNSFPGFKNYGIHPGQFLILKLIYNNSGIKQKEIVDITHRERSTITKTIQRLEKSGIIEKVYDDDKKSPSIILTTKGITIYEELDKMHEKDLKELGEILNEEDLDKIISVLHKIVKGFMKESRK